MVQITTSRVDLLPYAAKVREKAKATDDGLCFTPSNFVLNYARHLQCKINTNDINISTLGQNGNAHVIPYITALAKFKERPRRINTMLDRQWIVQAGSWRLQ